MTEKPESALVKPQTPGCQILSRNTTLDGLRYACLLFCLIVFASNLSRLRQHILLRYLSARWRHVASSPLPLAQA